MIINFQVEVQSYDCAKMGDNPPSSNPGSGYVSPGPPTATYQGTIPEDASTQPQNISPSDATAAFQGQYQQIYVPPANSYSGQTDMSSSGRQGPYDMSAMANSLQPSGYRTGYGPGQQHQQQRYHTPPGSNMIPQMVQFPGQPHMPQLSNQQYYIPQHQQISQYYNTPMPPTAQQHQMGSQPRAGMNIGFYQSSVMMNQSQTPVPGYYYPPSNQFPAQNPSIHGYNQSQYFVPDGSPGDAVSSTPLQRNNNNSRGVPGGLAPNEGMVHGRWVHDTSIKFWAYRIIGEPPKHRSRPPT